MVWRDFSIFYQDPIWPTNLPSVCQGIRDGDPDFIVTADSWPASLYPNGKANPEDVEYGLFQSAIMVKVWSSNGIF